MSKKNFIIRVDSSSEIGMGHLFRCLALANELVKLSAEVVFICRDHYGSGHNLVLDQNFKLYLLDGKDKSAISTKPEDWLGCSQSHDAFESSEIISKYHKASIIVDHYSLDYLWESNINSNSIIVIDDLANRRHKCKLLIDQSLKNTKSDYEKLIDGNFDFIGADKVILREEFNSAETWQGPGTNKLLICMGGADPFGNTHDILELIAESYKKFSKLKVEIEINVIVGAAYENTSNLMNIIEESELNISLIKDPPKISEFMLSSDLCILSCGSMILEACVLGVPSIGIVVADNQERTAELLHKAGAIELYNLKMKNPPEIFPLICSLIGSSQRLWNYSYKQKEIVTKSSSEIIARNLCER